MVFDSNVTLISKDNVEFQIHHHILTKTSAYFRQRFEKYGAPFPAITMEEDSATLDPIFRILRPGDCEPEKPSIDLLVSILKAVKRLQIESFALRIWLTTQIKDEPHPLRAWALASAFSYPDACRDALERYMRADPYYLHDRPKETRLVDGWMLFELVAAKAKALKEARDALASADWDCKKCNRQTLSNIGNNRNVCVAGEPSTVVLICIF